MAVLHGIKRKFIISQLILLGFFAWGVGFLYIISTVLFNPVQMRWEIFCFAWEALAFGIPLIVFRPMFRTIERYARHLEAGKNLGAQQAAVYHGKVLAYPFKVSLIVFFGSIGAYAIGAIQLRHFAQLPWEGVAISSACGVASALLWSVLEYFLLEHDLRPLTGLAATACHDLPPPERVSLKFKIFASSLALVVASLGFFGLMAYARTAHILEQEIGARLLGRMRELANLMSVLPRSATGRFSDAWRMLAAEFPVSPRGYFYLVDPAGNILATHPASRESGLRRLQREEILPAVGTTVLTNAEGYVADRVDHTKIVSFVGIPASRAKIVAIAPMADFSAQLDHLLYSGLTGMGFALLLCLGVGFLCARNITNPLAEVTRAAQMVAAKRDLTQRVTFVTNDEVGVLGQAFNQMAQELQTYSDELEQRVADRTKELAQRSEELEAKNTDLSDFLYVASHDLRAPLINLAGFSHALQDSVATLDRLMATTQPAGNGDAASRWPALKDDISESLGFILRSTAKMDTLVNALLELSRIETRPHGQQVVDTQQVVEELLGALHFQIAEKKITVVTGTLPTVFGDPVRINQVFSNLIDNAIKHMPPQPQARIEVGCEEDGRYYRFFVRDTGAGIRREDHDKVFRLFTRLGANGTPGEGVGLAAVKKIVDKHGGRIWVESEPGQGSTFWFTLPRPGSQNALPQTTAA